MVILARCGYVAKGVVYLLIGGIAAKVAIGAGGAVTDQKGALQTILEQPYGLGRILLGAVTIGLFGFALWCRTQALFDTEGKGTTAKGRNHCLSLPSDIWRIGSNPGVALILAWCF